MLHWRKGETTIHERPNIFAALAACGMPIEPVFCGGDRRTLQEREQWASGATSSRCAPASFCRISATKRRCTSLHRMGFRVVSGTSFLTGEDRIAEGERAVITFEGRRVGARRRRAALHDAVRCCATIPGSDSIDVHPVHHSLGTADTVLTERAASFSPRVRPIRSHSSRTCASFPARRRASPSTWRRRSSPGTSGSADVRRALDVARRRGGSARSAHRRSAAARAYGARSELDDASFVVVDVETTGARGRITAIASPKSRPSTCSDGVATTVFDTLINPERPIPPAIMALTNITSEMVRHAPQFADVCDQLLGVLEGHVFVAHNANFDWRFLSTEVERATRRPLIGRRLCTVRLARRLVPQLRRRNLDAIAHYYGIVNHRAAPRGRRCVRHRAGVHATARRRARSRLRDARRFRSPVAHAVETATRRRPAIPHPVERHDRMSTEANPLFVRRQESAPEPDPLVLVSRASSDACASTRSRPAARSSTAARCSASCPSRSGNGAFPPTSGIASSSACAAC